MMDRHLVTLEQHLIEEQRHTPGASGDFTGLMTAIAVAAKIIAREVRRAGLTSVLGGTSNSNVHGETQQKLDIIANDLLCEVLMHSGHLCAAASEELPALLPLPDETSIGKYALAFDPLDGSSNIDYNVSVGTIFSIHRRVTASGPGTEEDLLQPGSKLVAAGYVVYGSSTILVYSAGTGVHGFTLDPTIGEFVLSHPYIRTPSRGRMYSINEGNSDRFSPGISAYVDYLRSPTRPGGACTARYIGSLVADFHRNLLAGGVFLYPSDRKNPNGKLRLLYEAAPLAFIVEEAGGRASTGAQRIAHMQPTELHQRVPLIIGSREDVYEAEEFLRQEAATGGSPGREDREESPVPAVRRASPASGAVPPLV
ncbi:MAG TPA: class 1 fructose-bisphosphatase [Armatimonadota bacterium]|nr:class 1 fructose-bisphosphatase [Armatimonadota bacterium]